MDEPYFDIEVEGTTLRLVGDALRGFLEANDHFNGHYAALGRLCWTFADLDHAIDTLFEPLLQCSDVQVACMMVENISTRCTQLVRLIHLENNLEGDFASWLVELLNRTSGELTTEPPRLSRRLLSVRRSRDEQYKEQIFA